MNKNKQTNYTLPIKGLSGRPWNIQTIYDALKKCKGDPQAESDLNIQMRQMLDNLYECFEEELDNILSLNPDERKNLLSDVHKYRQKVFEWVKDGKDKSDLDKTERERLVSEYEFLVKRLRDLQLLYQAKDDKAAQKNLTDDYVKSAPNNWGMVEFPHPTIVSDSFIVNWSTKQVEKEQLSGTTSGKAGETKMSLREFLEKRTDVDVRVIDSKIKRIKAVDKTKHILPKTANKPKGNQTKLLL